MQHGTIEITLRQALAMNSRRRATGELGSPEGAWEWLMEHFEKRKAARAAASTEEVTPE